MANKGTRGHLLRLAAPRYLDIKRKIATYIIRQDPGRHTLNSSMALSTALKEKLKVAGNSGEARKAIKAGSVEINGKVVKEEKYPIGFGDVIFLKPSNRYYRVNEGKGGVFNIQEVEKSGATKRTMKVIGKYLAKGKKIMIRLHDGEILGADNKVRVNDSVVIEDGKVAGVIRLEKGAKCIVTKGVHAPETGVIEELKDGSALRQKLVTIKSSSKSFETVVENIMVVA